MPYSQLTVSQLVRADYRLADVFKKWGINYCCGGNHMLRDVCLLQDLKQQDVEAELRQAQQSFAGKSALQFIDWPLDFLADYILYVHHGFIKNTGHKLLLALEAFASGHQKRYPYIAGVYDLFKNLMAALDLQMQKDELETFPYVKKIFKTAINNGSASLFETDASTKINTPDSPLQQTILNLQTALRQVTNDYQFDENVCTNHQVIYHKLREMDRELDQLSYFQQNLFTRTQAFLDQQLLLQ